MAGRVLKDDIRIPRSVHTPTPEPGKTHYNDEDRVRRMYRHYNV